jgi:tRNA pseudouridine synthase 10
MASQKILNEYDLCDYCLGRLYAKKLSLTSHQKLGQKIHKRLRTKNTKCYICKNIFDNLHFYVTKMKEVASGYEFRTFLVGAKLKPSILDRDDHIRSQFRLKGIDGIKTNITRELAKQFSRKTKRQGQQIEPDITLTVDFKTESCQIQSKPIFVSGRYTKTDRNMPQKQKPCDNCLGKGCVTCNHHGISEFGSVEGVLSKHFFEKFGTMQVKITWIGGEDITSLVLGSGRPFFAKLINPKKRNLKFAKKIKLGKITIHKLQKINKIPINPIKFVSKTRLYITADSVSPDLSKLSQLKKSTVAIYENSGKRSEKTIHDISYKIDSENSFYLLMTVDGGVPLKRFVSGENVFPNVSDVLNTKCKCQTFDFDQVKIIH